MVSTSGSLAASPLPRGTLMVAAMRRHPARPRTRRTRPAAARGSRGHLYRLRARSPARTASVALARFRGTPVSNAARKRTGLVESLHFQRGGRRGERGREVIDGFGRTARSRARHGLGRGWRAVALAAVVPIAVVGAVVPAPPPAAAAAGPGVTEIRFTSVERPAFQGRVFGTVGQYEKIEGSISGAVDPNDPRNAPIADLANAPRNGQGLVEYTADFVLLRPVDLSRGNHRVVYEPTNR